MSTVPSHGDAHEIAIAPSIGAVGEARAGGVSRTKMEKQIMREGEVSGNATSSRTAATNKRQSKHTPGPWTWELACMERGYVDMSLANEGLPQGVIYHSAVWTPSAKDRALIAAAPELLAALKDLVSDAIARFEDMGIAHRHPAIRAAIAAVAKAEDR